MVVIQVRHSSRVVTNSDGPTTTITSSSTDGDGHHHHHRKRYQSGWKDAQQDHKISTRVAQVQAQSFEEIRNQCLEQGALWQDPDFPAVNQSVYYSTSLPQSFQWKRPSELVSDPRFFVGGASRFDIMQGDLGNCWFLASVAS